MAMDKTFDASAAEARIYEKWESSGAFKAGANAKPGADSFTIMIPPPNVTGALHLGHAFNNTLQDILIRWHRMRGFDTLWQPGQDHAGIATQLQVEKMLAETQQPGRRDLGREKFLEKVWEWKGEYGSTIIEQLKRLGSTCDWSRNAFTMAGAPGDPRVGHENSANFHDAVLKVFVDMYDKGLIYRGKRLVNWDPHFETAISDLEVENIETPGHMWHFKYPLAGGATYTYVEKDEDGNITLEEERNYISIATTRPETMLGDGAVAVHPDDERYAPIVGKLCEIPVGPKEHRRLIPIITDEYPDMNFGSGAVKITGAHDFNDYQVAKRGGIPMYSLMDTRGAMRADGRPYAEEAEIARRIANGEEDFDEAKIAAMNLVPDEYRGLDRFEARKLVVDQITAEGLAVMHDVTRTEKDEDGNETQVTETVPYVENKPIMQPFGDRSKVVIEPMLTDQWFVDAEKIAGPALDAVRNGDVKILPESGEKTFYHWLENIEPWCISRQLWWGHQVPVWYGPKVPADLKANLDYQRSEGVADGLIADANGEKMAFCAPNAEAAIRAARAYYEPLLNGDGLEVSAVTTSSLIGCELKDFTSTGDGTFAATDRIWVNLTRDPDVLDTWFSSGLWPFGTLGWPQDTDELNRFFPGDVLITGQDILFFWVARMMMMSQAVCHKNPFHTVYLHGLVRDEKGKKMSKTTGNVIDPLEIIDEYGADALRFTNTAMASIGGVLKMSKDRVAGYRNFGNKIWQSTSYSLINGCKPSEDFDPSTVKLTLNRWIISETAKTLSEVDKALAAYRFNDVAQSLYAFFWGKVCDWYVEFTKPVFKEGDTAAAEETRATLAWVIDQSLIMLHPVMPFITEELWGQIDENRGVETGDASKMLIHADWPKFGDELVDETASREMNWVASLIENIRSARAQMHVKAGLHIPVILQELDAAGRTALENNEALIKRMARVDSITEMADLPKGCITVAVAGGIFALPLAEIIDVDEEIARLEKTLGKLAKELGGLRGRLKNPKFAENAPAEVLAETKANLAAREEEEATLNAALDRLKEI